MTTSPIRNVYTAIELIMLGNTFASFRDRIVVTEASAMWWHSALGGAVAVLGHSNLQSTLAEMQSLADYVDSL